MDYTDKIAEIRGRLTELLSPKRYRHSVGVARMAEKLAGIYGADRDKAYFAGFVHDIAKGYDTQELNELVRKYGLPEEFIDSPALAHSKVGAEILKEEYGIDDEDVLNAVRYHTTGRANMSLLEEIVYVSDAIEQNRSYEGLRRLRMLASFDLDKACLEIIEFCIENVKRRGILLADDTIKAKYFIEDKIKGEPNRWK